MSLTGVRGIIGMAIAAAGMDEVSSRSREDGRGTDPQGRITKGCTRGRSTAGADQTGITDTTGVVGRTAGTAGMSLGAETDEMHDTADEFA